MKSLALIFFVIGAMNASPIPESADCCTYTVKAGDRAYMIAEKAKITVEELSELNNNFNDWTHLQIGQTLNVCKTKDATPSSTDWCKTYDPTLGVNPITNKQSCKECRDGYTLTSDASNNKFQICMAHLSTAPESATCPVGIVVNNKCLPIIEGCSTGGYNDDGTCSACVAKYTVDNGKCKLINDPAACPEGVATAMWKGKCVALIDGCSSSGYSDDGTKCLKCLDGYFYDNGKCSPVVRPTGCSDVDRNAGRNNVTNQLSCTACNTGFTLFKDPNNNNYQLCIQSSSTSSFDGGYAPLFGIVNSQYYCAKRHPDMKVGGWEEMVLDLCTDVQFKDENVFSGTMPIKTKDGNSVYSFADYVMGHNGKKKGSVTLTYYKNGDKQGTNFLFQNNLLQLKSDDDARDFAEGITTCAFIDGDHSVYLNPNGDKNSCARFGILTKV